MQPGLKEAELEELLIRKKDLTARPLTSCQEPTTFIDSWILRFRSVARVLAIRSCICCLDIADLHSYINAFISYII